MPDSFEMGAYLAHLRQRWRFVAIVVVAALGSSVLLTLLQTNRYTARVSLIIDPPASGDLRATTAISPIYMESLRSYEHFASSDHLFAEAADRFELRGKGRGSSPIEDLKRKILRVAIPRNTRILTIEVTLPDSAKAHQVATYLAEHTIELNRSAGIAIDGEIANRARVEAEQARERLQAAETALAEAMRQPPTPEALKADLERLAERRAEVERLALSASLAAAEIQVQLESSPRGRAPANSTVLDARLQSIRTRAEGLRAEAASLAAVAAEKQKQWSERDAVVGLLQGRLRAAQETVAETGKRAREISSISGYRNERISMLDPGFVPERPSSPRLPLHAAVALSLALLFSLVYLTIEYGLRAQPSASARQLPRVVGKA
jgi:uncharacterized protein involved in exopolysaccharide biosynthesis